MLEMCFLDEKIKYHKGRIKMTNSELKTLKDIKSEFRADWKEKYVNPEGQEAIEEMQKFLDENFIRKSDLKQEAIKWIKEDFEDINKVVNDLVKQELIILEYDWMKRLNITDEDLK